MFSLTFISYKVNTSFIRCVMCIKDEKAVLTAEGNKLSQLDVFHPKAQANSFYFNTMFHL